MSYLIIKAWSQILTRSHGLSQAKPKPGLEKVRPRPSQARPNQASTSLFSVASDSSSESALSSAVQSSDDIIMYTNFTLAENHLHVHLAKVLHCPQKSRYEATFKQPSINGFPSESAELLSLLKILADHHPKNSNQAPNDDVTTYCV